MKRQVSVRFTYSLLALSMLFLVSCSDRVIEGERFVVWGQDANGQCYIWNVDVKEKSNTQLASGNQDCNYRVVTIREKDYLVHSQARPGQISIYTLKSDGLEIQNIITTGEVEISSFPMPDNNGQFYFSGILDNKERIYRVNDVGDVLLLTNIASGMAYNPIPSPDSQYLAFQFFEGANNRHECIVECGSLYRIMAIDTQQELHIEEFIDDCSRPEHRSLEWSPQSDHVVFNVWCGQENQHLEIFSLANNTITAKIYSEIFSPSLYGWISEQEIVYDAVVDYVIDGYDNPLPIRRIFVYSLIDDASSELGNFPLITDAGNRFVINFIDWTENGGVIAGRLVDSVIITNRQNIGTIFAYSQIHEPRSIVASGNSKAAQFDDPAWSQSSEWLAYSSPEQTISFVDKTGRYNYSLSIPGITTYEFDWYSITQ